MNILNLVEGLLEGAQNIVAQIQSSSKDETKRISKCRENYPDEVAIQNNNSLPRQSFIGEKHILALLIKSERYQDLIHSLKNNSCLQPEDSSKLYGATQGLWIETTSKFEQSQIKQELINCNPVSTTSEYDVHFVTIELDKDDYRFYPDVNPMDRRDAFIDLGKRSPQVTVSCRLSCKAYENTEFYSR